MLMHHPSKVCGQYFLCIYCIIIIIIIIKIIVQSSVYFYTHTHTLPFIKINQYNNLIKCDNTYIYNITK